MRYETVELEIDVSELRVGIHVVRLDRPWEDTDFLIQGFVVQRQEDIDALQSQCRRVVIEGKVKNTEPDISQRKSRTSATSRFSMFHGPTSEQEISNRPQEPIAETGNSRSRQRITYINKVSVDREIRKASGHYAEAKSFADSIMSGLRVGRTLDLNKAREVVDNCVDSILRNEDALLLLTKLKNKDKYTAEHSLNVSILSAAFGKKLGLLEEEIRSLGLAGLLHDIGKAKVPVDLLQKPGPLTPEEHGIMQNHANWGRDMLMALPRVVHAAVDVAYNHHERLDGRGYPRGLVDSQIPYFAKIVAIVDTYDAITSNRAYDRARSSREALEIIHRFRGIQFDPELAREFVLLIGIYPPGAIVEMKSGEVAIVIGSNPKNRRKPKVVLVRDENKQRPAKYRLLDLQTEPLNSVGEPFEIIKEVPDGTYGIVLQRFIDNGLTLELNDASV